MGLRNRLLLLLLLVGLVFTNDVAASGMPVVDVANLVQNIKGNYVKIKDFMVKLRQVMYQVRSIQNEYEMIKNQGKYLEYQAKNIDKMDYGSLEKFVDSFFAVDRIINDTSSLYNRTEQMEKRLLELYPNYNLNGIEHRDEALIEMQKNRETIGTSVLISQSVGDGNKDDAERLKKLLADMEKADGNLKAQQAQAQLNAEMLRYLNQMKMMTAYMLDQLSMGNAREEQRRLRYLEYKQKLMKGAYEKHRPNTRDLPMLQ